MNHQKTMLCRALATVGVLITAACAQTPVATNQAAAPVKAMPAPVVAAAPAPAEPTKAMPAPMPIASAAMGSGTPAAVLGGLAHWKVTMPTDNDGNGKADEVKQPALANYVNNPYFRVSPENDGVYFRAIAGGATTSHRTAYSRSELREMAGDGTQNAAWDCTKSKRGMYIEEVMTHSTVAKPEATIAQIHDAKNDNLMVKYTGPHNANGVSDTGKIEVRFNNDTEKEVLDTAYTLGQPLSIDIDVNAGKMVLTYKNLKTGVSKVTKPVPFKNVKGACYFKAGMYIQACSKKNIYGKTNESCVGKGWPDSRYDAPTAYSEMLIRKIVLR